ncbi:MAG: TolC family protein, partial [Lentisphaeraceae bacterium]|nr:TolC family protein [Lentisphaeraceae bacterium]
MSVFNQIFLITLLVFCGCKNAEESYEYSDKKAKSLIDQKRQEVLKTDEKYTISPIQNSFRQKLLNSQNLLSKDKTYQSVESLNKPDHWDDELDIFKTRENHLRDIEINNLSLTESLMITAAHNTSFQSAKEAIFKAAVSLDMEQEDFRNTYNGLYDALLTSNQNNSSVQTGIDNSFSASVTRKLKSGASLAGKIVFDVSRILSTDKASSTGVAFDSSINIPLLAGSGEHIVTENLTQAERNLIYAIWGFEKIKRTLIVSTAGSFLSTIQLQDKLDNAAANYRSAIKSAERARRLAEAGRLPDNQVSQAVQRELDARARWIDAEKNYLASLDSF